MGGFPVRAACGTTVTLMKSYGYEWPVLRGTSRRPGPASGLQQHRHNCLRPPRFQAVISGNCSQREIFSIPDVEEKRGKPFPLRGLQLFLLHQTLGSW